MKVRCLPRAFPAQTVAHKQIRREWRRLLQPSFCLVDSRPGHGQEDTCFCLTATGKIDQAIHNTTPWDSPAASPESSSTKLLLSRRPWGRPVPQLTCASRASWWNPTAGPPHSPCHPCRPPPTPGTRTTWIQPVLIFRITQDKARP